MTPSLSTRTGGSTRSFATTDPERQGVFAGSARIAVPRSTLVSLASVRAAAPQAQGSLRTSPGVRVSAAPK